MGLHIEEGSDLVDSIIFMGFTLAYAGLFAWVVVLAQKNGWSTTANLILFVIFGLIYDNAILGIGRFIGEGELLEGLSYGRFYLHALFTPLLVVFSWNTVFRAGYEWAAKRWVKIGIWIAYFALVIVEVATEIAGLKLEASTKFGALSYSNASEGGGPPIMIMFVTVFLLAASILVWIRQKWPWFFVGTLLMGIGGAVDIPVGSDAIVNAFELILLISLVATKQAQDKWAREQKRKEY